MERYKENAKSSPALAQILTINPKYICGSGVFNTPPSSKITSAFELC